MSKIIITGAAGEVGLNLIPLLDAKDKIIAIDNNANNLEILKKINSHVEIVNADLAVMGSWKYVFKNADVVISLHAQISSPHDAPYEKNNVEATRNLVKICEKYKVPHLVHASSSVVISVADDGYTRTKRKGESFVKDSDIPFTILRPTLMFGAFDIKHLGYLIAFFEKSPIFPMPGHGKYIRQPLYVEDFCRIIISSIKIGPENKIYDITGKQKITLIDCIKTIYKIQKVKKPIIAIPLPIFYQLIRGYKLLNPKSRIIPDQLKAMTAGDIFPVIAWDKIFGVKATKFEDGVKLWLNSKYYRYAKEMTRLEE